MILSDAQAFLLVVAGLALLECVAAYPRGGVLLGLRGAGAGFVAGTNGLPGWASRGLHLANPLTPLAVRCFVPIAPLSLAADGVVTGSAQAFNPGPRLAPPGRLVRFPAEARDVLPSPRAEAAWSAWIARLAAAPAGGREAAIESILAEHADAGRAIARVASFRRATRPLAIVAAILLAFLVAGVPAVAAWMGLAASWPYLLGAGLALHGAAVVFAVRARRTLRREGIVPTPVGLLSVYLSPISATRAREALGADLLSDLHPLAAAAAVLDEDRFADYAGRVLRDLDHPFGGPVAEDDAAVAAEARYRGRLAASLRAMLAARGVAVASPAHAGPTCPRCGTAYRAGAMSCRDCGDLALA